MSDSTWRPEPTLSPAAKAAGSGFPADTITFLLTNIQGSTQLWERHPQAMKTALAQYEALLRQAVETNGGHVFKAVGDTFFTAFATPDAALAAAIVAQRALLTQAWGETGPLRVRMALHCGVAEEHDGDYFGPTPNRTARLLAAGHGGQILLSAAVQELVCEHLPAGTTLRDLGDCRLQDLTRPEHTFQLIAPDLPTDFPPLRSLEAFAHNLPVQLTTFIGRERELSEVKRLLTSHRLLTLTGAGGVGKTRLSLQVAADLIETFTDGVWLVELAPLIDPSLLPQAVASTLGVKEKPGQPLLLTALTNYLRGKHLLLILDNCEHLVTACARLAETLLQACPQVQILASSREALGITGEVTFRVPSLSLPDPHHPLPVERLSQFEATHLFIDRAMAALPTFTVTRQNAPIIAQICHRLDGIPLAIELAAAHVRVLLVEQILARLDDRFRLLTGGSRATLPRQQTLRALIDWSYDLLDAKERILLHRLSVFVSGWTLAAAETVCADTGDEVSPPNLPGSQVNIQPAEILDLLTQLVSKSLVLVEKQGDEARYRMLETIRQYSHEKLIESGENAIVHRRHATRFLQMAEEAAPQLRGRQQTVWLDRLTKEHDEIRSALTWCLEQNDAEVALPLGAALWRFWFLCGYLSEGRRWLDAALALAHSHQDQSPAFLWAWAHALDGNGVLALHQGDQQQAKFLFEASLALFRQLDNKAGMAIVLNGLGALEQDQGRYDQARTCFDESLALRRAMADRWGIASVLNNLGLIALRQGDLAKAETAFEENLELRRELDDKQGIALALTNLGVTALYRGDYASAQSLCTEGITLFRELNANRGIAAGLINLGRVAFYQGHYEEAVALQSESLKLFQQTGEKAGIAECLEGLACIAGVQGQYLRSLRLFGAAEVLRETIGVPLSPVDRAAYEPIIATIQAKLGATAFASAWAGGRALVLERAIRYALE